MNIDELQFRVWLKDENDFIYVEECNLLYDASTPVIYPSEL